MKKIFALAVLAFAVLTGCADKKEAAICVDKFYEAPAEYLGKTVTVTGHVVGFCAESGKLAFAGCEKQGKIVTNIPEGTVVDSTWKCKSVEVVGIISESTCPESGNKMYTMEATSLKITEACCGKEVKEGACCGEAKEGCAKDSTAAGCASKDSTAACAKKDSTDACCKDKKAAK